MTLINGIWWTIKSEEDMREVISEYINPEVAAAFDNINSTWKDKYEELEYDHSILQDEYDSLESEYDDLESRNDDIEKKIDEIKQIINNCTFKPYSEDSKVNIYQAMDLIKLICEKE